MFDIEDFIQGAEDFGSGQAVLGSEVSTNPREDISNLLKPENQDGCQLCFVCDFACVGKSRD